MAYNNIISANDPMAINMLKENLAHFENNTAYMQAVNDFYKENGTMVGFEGIDYAIVNLANNRLQLYFEEKPADEQRATLKSNGFKYAPSTKAWQRPLDYKTMAAANRIDFIKPLDGKTPMDLQPKMAKRDAPER